MSEVREFKIDLEAARINVVWIELSTIVDRLCALVIEPSGKAHRIERPVWSALLQMNDPLRLSGFDSRDLKVQELARAILQAATGEHSRPVYSLSLFMSPKGAITPPHFDMPTVAVCQIEGEKLLRVQARPRCSRPKADGLVSEPGLTYEIERTLSASDGILIPPGHVHTTVAVTRGLTLGVGFIDA